MTAYKNIPSGLENDKNSHADRIDRSKAAQSRKTASLKVEREKENKPPRPLEGGGFNKTFLGGGRSFCQAYECKPEKK